METPIESVYFRIWNVHFPVRLITYGISPMGFLTLSIVSADDMLKYFLIFPKTGDSLYETYFFLIFPSEILFSGKNKKNITNVSSAELAQ